jgi:hypothetical protein
MNLSWGWPITPNQSEGSTVCGRDLTRVVKAAVVNQEILELRKIRVGF